MEPIDEGLERVLEIRKRAAQFAIKVGQDSAEGLGKKENKNPDAMGVFFGTLISALIWSTYGTLLKAMGAEQADTWLEIVFHDLSENLERFGIERGFTIIRKE